MKTLLISITLCLTLVTSSLMAQSVSEARNAYTGSTSWNASTGTLTISSTGTFNFSNRTLLYNNVWYIPSEVNLILIKNNVTVTGEFYADYDCTIRGENQYTSIVFGTPEQDYLGESRGFYAFASAPAKARDVSLTIKNLTSLNPKVYHCWGSYRGVVHADSCRFIDDRGGRWNNSDGYVSAGGGTVKNCYFKTGDDVIKIYNDITVENTTIDMEFFSVPIQCGWGNYGDNVTAVFKNLTITGNSGRAPNYALIEARQGNYTKHIIIDGLTYTNPNGSLFHFQQAAATINVEITNAYIDINKYGGALLAAGTRTICGTTQQKSFYDCSNNNPNPAAIPGKIEAESFTAQSGIQTEATSDVGGGENVGWINAGDWTEYLIDVTQGGSYDVDFRVASGGSGGTITIKADNTTVGSVNVPGTGGWQTWSTVSTNVNLSVGEQTLRLEYGGGAGFLFNLNWADFTSASSSPIGQDINLIGNNGLYVSSENGINAMNCNRASAGAWEKFSVVDAGNGKVALKGNNGKYVTDGSPMWCNTSTITNAAKFTWTDAGGGLIALLGNNGNYVSSENGTAPMNCNRAAIGAWEKFSWNIVPKSSIETSVSDHTMKIHPNPASEQFTISGIQKDFVIEVYDTQGKLQTSKVSNGIQETVDIQKLKKGIYIIRLVNNKAVNTKILVVK